jgi:hypothetical protein
MLRLRHWPKVLAGLAAVTLLSTIPADALTKDRTCSTGPTSKRPGCRTEICTTTICEAGRGCRTSRTTHTWCSVR